MTRICLVALLFLVAVAVQGYAPSLRYRAEVSRAVCRKQMASLCLRPSPSTWRRPSAAADDVPDSKDDNEETELSSEAPEASSPAANDKKKDTDILSSPAFLKRKLEVLQAELAKTDEVLAAAKERLEAGKAEWGGKLEEMQKEYNTIQSRMNTQSKEGDVMATINVARQMLEVLDNFDRAFGAVTATTETEQAIEAEYRNTSEMILQAFEKLGIEVVPTVGMEFDYEYHQAVMQKASDEFEEGVVCEEFQRGFKLGDKLIRAAMVAVAA